MSMSTSEPDLIIDVQMVSRKFYGSAVLFYLRVLDQTRDILYTFVTCQ